MDARAARADPRQEGDMSEFYPYVTKPLKGAKAFTEVSETASQAQAAILLKLGRQLRGDDEALTGLARGSRAGAMLAEAGAEDDPTFPVPRLRPSRTPVSRREARAGAAEHFGFAAGQPASAQVGALAEGAKRLYKDPTVDTAAELMEMCLGHDKALVQIAAASAYFPVTTDPARCVRILATGVKSADSLEREVAATALARIQPDHPALRGLGRMKRARARRRAPETITLVHGTFATNAEWYQPPRTGSPGGDFFTYVRGLRADLYDQPDFFRWTGGYSDAARDLGAVDLERWVRAHNESGLDIMGHSHGANVILRATQLGMQAGKVVLLSCPVHVHKYMPDFSRVQKPVFSVRVRLDLVILADRGGQRFNHPDIKEIVLPIWFDHGASHNPQVWKDHGVDKKIKL
jgi:hypothetical protein